MGLKPLPDNIGELFDEYLEAAIASDDFERQTPDYPTPFSEATVEQWNAYVRCRDECERIRASRAVQGRILSRRKRDTENTLLNVLPTGVWISHGDHRFLKDITASDRSFFLVVARGGE